MPKSTLKQKLAFKELLNTLQKQQPVALKNIMLKAGFSLNTAINPSKNLTSKIGWQQLLNKIDNEPLIDKLNEIALKRKDSRANIAAISELLKIKDLYPDKKIKVSAYDERESVLE